MPNEPQRAARRLYAYAGGVLLVVAAASIKRAAAASAVVAVLRIVLTAFCSHAIGHWPTAWPGCASPSSACAGRWALAACFAAGQTTAIIGWVGCPHPRVGRGHRVRPGAWPPGRGRYALVVLAPHRGQV